MKALISPIEQAVYISSWESTPQGIKPVFTQCGVRVAEVCEVVFEVAPPLFFVDCDDTVVADVYCYVDGQIQKKPDNVAPPENPIPVTVAE